MLLVFALPVLAWFAQAAAQDGSSGLGVNGSEYWSNTVILEHPKCKPTSVRLAVFSDPDRCYTGGRASVQIIVEDISAPSEPGYGLVDGMGVYKLHTRPTTWFDAKVVCEKEGGHLAVINSEAEAQVLAKIIDRERIAGDWFFIGFHDQDTEGVYVTIFGDSLQTAGYTRWNPHQPDNDRNNENCGSISRSGGLNDYPCDYRAPFFCEQDK